MEFTVTPNSLNIEPRVESQHTVHLDYFPKGGHPYYPTRVLDLPPNVIVKFPINPLLTPVAVTIFYDPKQSGAVASGKYKTKIEMNVIGRHDPRYVDLMLCFKDESKQKEEVEEKQTNSLLECGICYQEFDEVEHMPKMLSCGHTFCWDCIANIQSAHNTPMPFGRPSYSCPVDRIDIDQPASALPKNRLILDLIEEKKREQRKKGILAPIIVEDPDVPCFENDKHESSVYCENCKESFCSSCNAYVHASKMLSKHTCIPVADRPLIIPMCPSHPQLPAQFVCQDEECQSLSCSFCLSNHQNHHWKHLQTQIADNIEFLEDVVDQLKSTECVVENRIWKNQECAMSFNPRGEGMQRLMKEIDDHFAKKQVEARDRLLIWAYDKQHDLTVKRSDSERILGEIQKKRKKVEQKLKRKMDLHTDVMTEFEDLDTEVSVTDQEQYFHLEEHNFSPNMSKTPSSPIVLSACPSPVPPPPPPPEPVEPPRKTLKREANPIMEDLFDAMKDIDEDEDGEVVDVES